MSQLVQQYKAHPRIRQTALDLVGNLPPKKWAAEVKALFVYVRDGIRYTRDTTGVETIQTPLHTLDVEQGDCDDKSTLLASLLETIGHPTRFVAVGNAPGRYSHVFVQTPLAGRWVSLDPTMSNWDVGQQPASVQSVMIANN